MKKLKMLIYYCVLQSLKEQPKTVMSASVSDAADSKVPAPVAADASDSKNELNNYIVSLHEVPKNTFNNSGSYQDISLFLKAYLPTVLVGIVLAYFDRVPMTQLFLSAIERVEQKNRVLLSARFIGRNDANGGSSKFLTLLKNIALCFRSDGSIKGRINSPTGIWSLTCANIVAIFLRDFLKMEGPDYIIEYKGKKEVSYYMTRYTGKKLIRKFYHIKLDRRAFKIVYSMDEEHTIDKLCELIYKMNALSGGKYAIHNEDGSVILF